MRTEFKPQNLIRHWKPQKSQEEPHQKNQNLGQEQQNSTTDKIWLKFIKHMCRGQHLNLLEERYLSNPYQISQPDSI